MALCTPIRNTAASSSSLMEKNNPPLAASMMAISKTLTPMVMVRLLKRSAKKPPYIENRMKGREKIAATAGTNLSRSAGGSPMPSTSTVTSFCRALSLKAPWNCVTIRLQKPRFQFSGATGKVAECVCSIDSEES